MINAADVRELSEKLRVYDVVQGGWEQEPNGYEENVNHVLLHLVKDSTAKDFTDPTLLRTAIAPDALQYAIRLGRWSNQDAVDLMPTETTRQRIRELAPRFGLIPVHQLAHLQASTTLAHNLHGLDHKNDAEQAAAETIETARMAAGFLLYAANLQATQYKFDLKETFDARLLTLRQKFNIPEPEFS